MKFLENEGGRKSIEEPRLFDGAARLAEDGLCSACLLPINGCPHLWSRGAWRRRVSSQLLPILHSQVHSDLLLHRQCSRIVPGAPAQGRRHDGGQASCETSPQFWG